MYRIVGGPTANNLHVYDENGDEVRGITRIQMDVAAGEVIKVILTMHNICADLSISEENVNVSQD